MGGGSFALPFLRTEMPLQDIPVFRMAYSAPTAHRAVSSETLMLQVRCAHPPMPHRTSSSSCSGVPVGLFSEKALQLFLQNARPSAAMRLPMGGGSFAPPAPLSPAPAVLIFPLCKRRRICFQTDRQDAAAPERSSFLCQDSIPVISRQPALRRLTFPAARPAPQSGRRRRRCRSKA